MNKLDNFILTKIYQPIADFVMDTLEKCCYWCARQALILFLAGLFFEILVIAIGMPDVARWTMITRVLLLILFSAHYTRIKEAEQTYEKTSKATASQWGSFTSVAWLYFWLFDLFFVSYKYDILSALNLFSDFAASSYIYFSRCLPHPPRKKSQKLVHAWSSAQ